MTDNSRARLFFNEVIGKKEQAFGFLCSLLKGGDAAAENGWREYKEAGFIGKTGNEGQEKEMIKAKWSENLSAFANTGGGVLIWGFHTKGKVPDKLSLADDCDKLVELLRSFVNDATDPYVTGVEVEAIHNPAHPNEGFVICSIPASTFAPHQAHWGERTYFVRAQDSNMVCPPPLLRHMFYPRSRSRLEPIVVMGANQQPDESILVHLRTRIVSLGPATAESAIISIEPRDLDHPRINFEVPWETIGVDNIVRYRFPLPPNFVPPQQLGISGTLLANGASAVFVFFTHDTPVHHSTVSFSQKEVLECMKTGQTLEKRGKSNPIFL